MKYPSMRDAFTSRIVLLIVTAVTALNIRGRIATERAAFLTASLGQRLLDAKIGEVPEVIAEIDKHRQLLGPWLKEVNQAALPGSSRQIRTSLALLPVDPAQADWLWEPLLSAEPDRFCVLLDALAGHAETVVPFLKSEMRPKPNSHARPMTETEKQLLDIRRASAAVASTFGPFMAPSRLMSV